MQNVVAIFILRDYNHIFRSSDLINELEHALLPTINSNMKDCVALGVGDPCKSWIISNHKICDISTEPDIAA